MSPEPATLPRVPAKPVPNHPFTYLRLLLTQDRPRVTRAGGDALRRRSRHVPWQQGFDFDERRSLGQIGEDAAQISVWLAAVGLCRLNDP